MYTKQIQLPAKLLDYFLCSNKSNINQHIYIYIYIYIHAYIYIYIRMHGGTIRAAVAGCLS